MAVPVLPAGQGQSRCAAGNEILTDSQGLGSPGMKSGSPHQEPAQLQHRLGQRTPRTGLDKGPAVPAGPVARATSPPRQSLCWLPPRRAVGSDLRPPLPGKKGGKTSTALSDLRGRLFYINPLPPPFRPSWSHLPVAPALPGLSDLGQARPAHTTPPVHTHALHLYHPPPTPVWCPSIHICNAEIQSQCPKGQIFNQGEERNSG